MKRIVAVLSLLSVFMLSGCFAFSAGDELTTAEIFETTEIVITVIPETSVQISQTEAEEVSSDVYESETVQEITSAEESSTVHEPLTETYETTTRQEDTTAVQTMTEIDLGITMPEKNGTMVVDISSSNKFIKIIKNKKDIDTSLLAAVYSVPDSGQNYVFEFYDEEGREADDIRRVYLIDTNGKITGVAAVNSSEKENISAVENWFCMNVLIKELVYPAVSKELK